MHDNEVAPGVYREEDYEAGVLIYWMSGDEGMTMATVPMSETRFAEDNDDTDA